MMVRYVLVGSIGTLRMLEGRLKVLGDLGVVLETGVIKVARLAVGHELILNSITL